MTLPINNTQIVHTTAEWQSLNPTLAADVIGIEVMSNGYNRYKRGDGSTAWLSLAYIDKVYDTDKQDKTDTLTAETTLADDDQFPFYDASASGHRKTLWSNIKAKLKAYFDTLYAAASHVHNYLPLTGGTMTGALKLLEGLELNPWSSTANHGGYIDFHYNQSTADYTSRIIEETSYLDIYSDKAMIFNIKSADTSYPFILGCSSGTIGLDLRSTVDSKGQVGTSSYRLYKVYSTNGVATSSDKRVKNSIDDDLSAYNAFFAALRPVRYKYKSDGDGAKYRMGFIAQEVEQALIAAGLTLNDFAGIFIDDVSEAPIQGVEDNRLYGLNYAEFVALNTKMIQQQQSEIEVLKARVEALERR